MTRDGIGHTVELHPSHFERRFDVSHTFAETRPAHSPPSRLALLFAVIATTSAVSWALALLSYLRPAGDGDSLPGYADVLPMRGYLWAFFVIAGVNLIVGVCAAALAALILAPERGARWATAGGSLLWLGAAVYGVGIGGWATVYYAATDPDVLRPSTGAALVDHLNDDALHMLAVPVAGAIMIAVGVVVISVGLWRARTVPRWVLICGVAASLAVFMLPPSRLAGVVSEAVSSLTTILVGWYAWRGPSTRVRQPATAISSHPLEGTPR
jgi:hypothetical protein